MLILIGLRAAGKSTLARALGARTGRPHADLDDLTGRVLGCKSASEALLTHGLPAFRAAELQALRTFLATASPDHILALGGGTPTIPESHTLMRPHTVIYLRATAATLQARLLADTSVRPALAGSDAISEVPELLAQRDDLYRMLATHTLDIDALSDAEVESGILPLIRA